MNRCQTCITSGFFFYLVGILAGTIIRNESIGGQSEPPKLIINLNDVVMNDREIVLNNGEGTSFWVLGDLYTFKATGKQTNGGFTVIDQIIQPGGGPPPHVHRREDEAFYVLEGKFSFLSGEKQTEAGAGAFVYVPKGTLHTFKNIGAQPGRLLVTITPAGLEEFFYAIGSPAKDLKNPPPFDPAVIDKIMKLADEYSMEVMMPDMK